jgi:competence protein CoiA
MLRSRNIHGDNILSTNCDEESVRKLSKSKELYCPNCGNVVLYKNGLKKIAHFAHRPSTECVVSNYESETAEHLKGKQVLYSWLTSKYPTASVELEVYISVTEQIADVLVTHQSGEFQGQRWAFEFQHSPLSEIEWRRRHSIYREANIKDFWIFDTDIFLQYSQAQDMNEARRFREPIKTVFDETGFTYFLDITSEQLTVDCKFYVRSIERRLSSRGGIVVKNDYTFHDPSDHTDNLNEAIFHYHSGEQFTALYIHKVRSQFESRFYEIIEKIENERHSLLLRKRQERFGEIISYCEEKVSEMHFHVFRTFCLSNKALVVDDLLDMEIPEFIEKYLPYVERIIHYLQEFELIRKSDKVVDRVVTDLAPSYQQYRYLSDLDLEIKYRKKRRVGEIYDYEFIQDVDSLSTVLYEIYSENIKNVEYVIERYSDVLNKLLSFNQKLLEKMLNRISWKLSKYRNEPSIINYALCYAECSGHEEIDELIKRVQEEIVDYDPFRDLD